MRKKKIISAFLVGVLSLSNCFQSIAMETQGSTIISNETPIEMETQQQEKMVTPEMPSDVENLIFEEKETIGAGHSFSSATYVSVNAETVDSLIDGETNYYVFTLLQNGKINIDFSHKLFESSSNPWKIYLYDYNHNQIDYFYSSDGYTKSTKSFNYGLAAGKYYLIVEYNSSWACNNYSFKINYTPVNNWETEFNNSWLSADTLQLNQTFYGSQPEGSDDYYVFTLPKNGKINIDFLHELFESSSNPWKIYLYDYNHNQIDYFYSSDGYTKSAKSFDYGLSAGKYYLIVEYNSSWACNDYSFKINYTPVNNWETEFNNSWLSADTLQLNQTFYGSQPEGSDDYYVFTLSKNGKINIDFSHELFDSSSNPWKIYLYDYNYNQIDYFYSSNGYTKSMKSFDYGLSAGKYYLIVEYNNSWACNNYSFKINTKPALNETFQYGSGYFKVKKEGLIGEVQFVKPTSKPRTAYTIPSKIKYRGFEYNVVSVASDAFKDNKKLKSVTIGKNVTVLGNSVFYGCKNLKKVTVKSTKLKKVGSNSFKGIHKKAVIKVPKSKLSKYKKLFNGKGQAKTVKIKK